MFFLLLFLEIAAHAEVQRLTLAQALNLGLENNGEVLAERAQVRQAQADYSRVGGEFGPKVEALAGFGPNTGATGNPLSGETNKDVVGRTLLGNITVTQPIYSFGRAANYRAAATSGIKVKEAQVRLKEDELRVQIKEAYYGYLFAKSMEDFIQEGRQDLDRVLKDKSKLSKKDNYKLDIFLAQVDAKEAEVKKNVKLALEGLNLRIGIKSENIAPKENWLDMTERKLEKIEFYENIATENRGEFAQLREGILAKSKLASAERGAYLPIFAALAKYDFADTNVRAKQTSPFANDPFNRSDFVVGLGLKWEFQWGLPQAKAGKLTAEVEELEAKASFADRGILTQVKKAFWEVEEANTKLTAAMQANKASKKWLSGELMVLGTGLGSAKLEELAVAYLARAEATKSFYQAIFEQQMAWARLSQAVGKELDASLR